MVFACSFNFYKKVDQMRKKLLEKSRLKIRNNICITSVISVAFLYIDYKFGNHFEGLNAMAFPILIKNIISENNVCYIIKKHKNFFKPKTDLEWALYKNVKGHHCIYAFKEEKESNFLEITTMTSMQNTACPETLKFPFPRIIKPEIVIPKGLQAVAGITRKMKCVNTKEFDDFFSSICNDNLVFNESEFHNLKESDVERIYQQIIRKNVVLYDDIVANYDFAEKAYFFNLISLKQELPLEINLGLWCPSQKHEFSIAYSKSVLQETNKYFFKNNLLENPEIAMLIILQKKLFQNPSFYQDGYPKSEWLLESLVKLNNQPRVGLINQRINQANSNIAVNISNSFFESED